LAPKDDDHSAARIRLAEISPVTAPLYTRYLEREKRPTFESGRPADTQRELAFLDSAIAEARQSGGELDAHLLMDAFVVSCLAHRVRLTEAKQVADDLVRMTSDRTHLGLLARVLEELGELDAAAKLAAQSEQAPEEHFDEEVHLASARAALDLGLIAEAEAFLTRALALWPNHGEVKALIAEIKTGKHRPR
jgi:tetratricopeptide (TPR) repeat protein